MININKDKKIIDTKIWKETNKVIDLVGIYYFWRFLARKLFTNPSTLIAIILPLLLLTTLPIVMPASIIYLGILSISLDIVIFLAYGSTFLALRRTNLYETIKSTRFNKFVMYSATFLFLFLIAYSAAWILLTAMICFSQIPGFYKEWIPAVTLPVNPVQNIDYGLIDFSTGSFGLFAYWAFISTILTSSIAFFIQSITKNIKAYMATTTGYIVLSFFVGGILGMDMMWLYYIDGNGNLLSAKEYAVLNNIPADKLSGWYNKQAEFIGDPNGKYVFGRIYKSIYDDQGKIIGTDIKWFPLDSFQWWAKHLLPNYFINQTSTSMFWAWPHMEQIASNGEKFVLNVSPTNSLQSEIVYMYIMPYVYILSISTFGWWISKVREKRN